MVYGIWNSLRKIYLSWGRPNLSLSGQTYVSAHHNNYQYGPWRKSLKGINLIGPGKIPGLSISQLSNPNME